MRSCLPGLCAWEWGVRERGALWGPSWTSRPLEIPQDGWLSFPVIGRATSDKRPMPGRSEERGVGSDSWAPRLVTDFLQLMTTCVGPWC